MLYDVDAVSFIRTRMYEMLFFAVFGLVVVVVIPANYWTTTTTTGEMSRFVGGKFLMNERTRVANNNERKTNRTR